MGQHEFAGIIKETELKIIVTGGAGFIGSNFIYYMLSEHPEDKLVCIDSLTYAGDLSVLSPVMDKIVFYRTDIRNRKEIDRIFQIESPDIIVNFAAESHVDNSIENPAIFLDTNIIGTAVLLDACRKYGITRFHQISTDEVYGDLPLNEPELKFTEASPLKPSSPYSASKASADLLVLAYHRTYGLDITISRCSNNFGPNQNREKLIPKTIYNAIHDIPIPIYGNGMNIRDWIYVEDHCRAVDDILRKGSNGEIYNIGCCNEISNIDIVKQILHMLGKPESLIVYTKDRKGHDLRYALDNSKLVNEIGFRFSDDFDSNLEKTIRSYLEKPEYKLN